MNSYSSKKRPPINCERKGKSFDQLFFEYVGLVNKMHSFQKAAGKTTSRLVHPVVRFLSVGETFPIWVADANPNVPLLMRLVFSRIAPTITPTFFPDGDEVLRTLTTTLVLPRVILLDLHMKRVSGFDTLHQIRAQSIYRHLPVVMLTASSDEVDRKKALTLGADDFLTKPLAFKHTISMIRFLLEKWF